ncbi:coenzyme Q-binding protein COQ10 homolog B, mitochondrial-like isoform X2 [Macrosteles quadrilineatus]|uniref:coenzyme Q-binding protein COQ10 homolog B, mitochondrial-like isoform X1 n=1 Tax=Macrosteles quadrilineatus TaxID=74068 RepID=UPI0023E33BE1|nr:coenzyme Q-binding protein COQ10 homolog B, mitochondrial-like isoform X1 [Macrosteles quadrilineatus]XP_054288885.1 coenzyme Q-binding protein COQ10 homolog B, mitochondrial-like isoform X2 [Macrosteles quadrilineatus]
MCSRRSVLSVSNKAFNCFCKRSRSQSPRLLTRECQPETLPSLRTLNSSHSEEVLVSPCRSFFTLPGSPAKTRKFTGKKLVGFTMEEMYEVVSDVENYKAFVPFCKRSNVLTRTDTYLKGELEIGFPPIVESYVSHVTLDRPRLVVAECKDGKLFDHLVTSWKFSPGLKNKKRSCVIDFHVDFQFKSVLHSQLAHMFFNELVRQMESAFFDEAERRFGAASMQTIKLKVTPSTGS